MAPVRKGSSSGNSDQTESGSTLAMGEGAVRVLRGDKKNRRPDNRRNNGRTNNGRVRDDTGQEATPDSDAKSVLPPVGQPNARPLGQAATEVHQKIQAQGPSTVNVNGKEPMTAFSNTPSPAPAVNRTPPVGLPNPGPAVPMLTPEQIAQMRQINLQNPDTVYATKTTQPTNPNAANEVLSRVGQRTGDPNYNAAYDIDHNGFITLADVLKANQLPNGIATTSPIDPNQEFPRGIASGPTFPQQTGGAAPPTIESITAAVGTKQGGANYNPSLDTDHNGYVTLADVLKFKAQQDEYKAKLEQPAGQPLPPNPSGGSVKQTLPASIWQGSPIAGDPTLGTPSIPYQSSGQLALMQKATADRVAIPAQQMDQMTAAIQGLPQTTPLAPTTPTLPSTGTQVQRDLAGMDQVQQQHGANQKEGGDAGEPKPPTAAGTESGQQPNQNMMAGLQPTAMPAWSGPQVQPQAAPQADPTNFYNQKQPPVPGAMAGMMRVPVRGYRAGGRLSLPGFAGGTNMYNPGAGIDSGDQGQRQFVGSGGSGTIGNAVRHPAFGFSANAPYSSPTRGILNNPGVSVMQPWKYAPRTLRQLGTSGRDALQSQWNASGGQAPDLYEKASFAEPGQANSQTSWY